jgi:hypothetical protein
MRSLLWVSSRKMNISLREASLIRLSCYLLKVTLPSRETLPNDVCKSILTIPDATPQRPSKNKWIFHGAREFPIQPIRRMAQSRTFTFAEKSKKESEQCKHLQHGPECDSRDDSQIETEKCL